MGVLNRSGECIRLRILVGNAHAGEEERDSVQWKGWLPEHERITDKLDNGPDDKGSARSQAGTEMDVRERGGEPSSEVDEVENRDWQQANVVSWLQIWYEDTRGRVCYCSVLSISIFNRDHHTISGPC